MKKSPGERFKQKGFAPNLPVLILPGLCSSCLKVVESPYKEWNDRRIWLDITTIGFGKVWDQIGLKKRKKNNISQTQVVKKIQISSPTNFTSTRAIADMYQEELISVKEELEEEEEYKVELDIDQGEKRRWIAHMVLQADGVTDPPGIRLRPLEGIRGVMYLDPGAITNSLSYVFGPLVETYWDIGYTDANIRAAPYDWRVPPYRLEERDQYFTKLKEMIEDMVNVNKKKIVMLAHSLGTRLVHYFLRRVNHLYGRQWISDHIHTWVAIGPLFLGAPKSVRAITSGERMGLDAFLFEEEGLDLSRLCGSSCWMFPYVVPDYDFEEYVFKTNNGQWVGQSIKDTLIESGVGHIWDNYVKYYHQDPYFGTQEDQLKAPPVDRLFAIYGINLRTEAFYFYKKSNGGISALELDSKGQLSNYECQGGIAFETKDTRQNKLKGRKRGGDGTVPYPSLSYCTYWKDEINVIIEELEGAEHREILKDKSFTKTVVEYVCTAPPPPKLPETFRELRYEVQEIRDNKKANRTVVFTRKNVELYRPNGQVIFKKKYPLVNSVMTMNAAEQIFVIEIQGMTRIYLKSDKYHEISQELMVRLKFIEYSRSPTEEQRDELGQTELHRAVLENDISLVRELLSDDRDINAQDKNDWTPLHCATYKRHLDIALLLLKSPKIDTSLLTKDATSSFHYLVRPGPDSEPLEEVLEHFLESGINVNVQSKGGATPLHHAAMYGSLRSARWLISKFANVNAKNENGETALHIAIYQNNRDLIELLLNNGGDKHISNNKGKTPLACAQSISTDLIAFVRDFKAAGFRARALFSYQGFGSQELSFKEGDRINKIHIDDRYGNGWWFGECNGISGYFPSNYVKISEVIQDSNRPPLGSPEPEDSPADVRDEYGQTPLHKAAYEDRCEAVFELIIAHANVNAVDRNGWTPFHCAASKGNLEVMLLLQQQPGIKLSIRSTDGTTALHYLVRHKFEPQMHQRVIKILERFLTLSVDLDILGKNDETPLHQAVMRDNEFMVKFLLENGANVNAMNDSRTTPLFYAVGTRSVKLIELLLRYGADPMIKGKRGSPLDCSKGEESIYNLLARHVTGDQSSQQDLEPPPVPERKNGVSQDVIRRAPIPARKRSTISHQFALINKGKIVRMKADVEEDFVEYTPTTVSFASGQEDIFAGLLSEKFQGNLKNFEEACIKYIMANRYKNDRSEFMKSFDALYPPPRPLVTSSPQMRSPNTSTEDLCVDKPEKEKKSGFFKKKKDKKK